MDYVLHGLTNGQICSRMQINATQREKLVAGLQLPSAFNVVDATRDGLISWSFSV